MVCMIVMRVICVIKGCSMPLSLLVPVKWCSSRCIRQGTQVAVVSAGGLCAHAASGLVLQCNDSMHTHAQASAATHREGIECG